MPDSDANKPISDQHRHRARGYVRHLATLLGPDTAAGMRVALSRDAGPRLSRGYRLAVDSIRERWRPTRERMRALTVSPGGRVYWRDVPVPPPPAPGGAIVHPIAVTTCDLDRPLALGMSPLPLPLCPGHECVAEVVSIGDGVRTVAPGDRVVVPCQISCGTCTSCAKGDTAHCLSVPPVSMYGLGVTTGSWGGALSDLLAVPYADAMLVPLPDGISPAAAAGLGDNVSDAYRRIAPHAAGLLARGDDARVLILCELGRRPPYGTGLALSTGLVAKALGLTDVHLVDRRPALRRQAEELGIQAHSPDELTKLPLAPLVVEATGTRSGMATAIRHTAPDGDCTSIGTLHSGITIPTSLMYLRDISLHIGLPPARTLIPDVLDLMTSGRFHPEHVITDEGSLDDAENTMRRYIFGDSVKTVFVE
ncbi:MULTISPECIES: zinc-binding dehydrogenase [unclassified Nocardia]|uniref:zinc-dependent alcohol dehydrogenase n=1 Tax=unclassified Nocardia TaxID=2637762 RepID=UPI001CE49815|nr:MULTISPECIES: alcohol dehydrogenase catalytic domain-containing protein [unclassified Nocardia]